MSRPAPILSRPRAVPCSDDTPDARRSSAEKLVSTALSELEFEDVLRATLFHFTPVYHQSRQCERAASFLGLDRETPRRWIAGHTTPRARDVWPLMFVVILQQLPVQTQVEVMQAITGLVEGAS